MGLKSSLYLVLFAFLLAWGHILQKMVLNQGGYLLSFGCTGFEDGKFVVHERRYDYMALEVVSDKAGVGYLDMDPEIDIVVKKR